jgi:hypothetical protein
MLPPALPFIANSDFHKPKHIYSWKTLIHAAKDAEAIKDCIRRNEHVAITLYRDFADARQKAPGFESTSHNLPCFQDRLPLHAINSQPAPDVSRLISQSPEDAAATGAGATF